MEKKKMRGCYGKAITLLSVVLLCGCQKVDIPEEETPISKDNCVEIKSTYVSPVEYYGRINELADWFIQDNNLVIIDRDSEKGLVLKKIELK